VLQNPHLHTGSIGPLRGMLGAIEAIPARKRDSFQNIFMNSSTERLILWTTRHLPVDSHFPLSTLFGAGAYSNCSRKKPEQTGLMDGTDHCVRTKPGQERALETAGCKGPGGDEGKKHAVD
jgi:hypothetical protein